MKQALVLAGLLAAGSCNSPSTPATATTHTATAAQPAASTIQQAVAGYIKANSATFAGYEPVRWGRPVAYTKMSEATTKGLAAIQQFDKALAARAKALAEYNAALARRETSAKTEVLKMRYRNATKHNDALLATANSFAGVKDTTRLGTQLVHVYRTRAKSGVMVLDSAAFVVHNTGAVEQL